MQAIMPLTPIFASSPGRNISAALRYVPSAALPIVVVENHGVQTFTRTIPPATICTFDRAVAKHQCSDFWSELEIRRDIKVIKPCHDGAKSCLDGWKDPNVICA